jgi:hypothetical protein
VKTVATEPQKEEEDGQQVDSAIEEGATTVERERLDAAMAAAQMEAQEAEEAMRHATRMAEEADRAAVIVKVASRSLLGEIPVSSPDKDNSTAGGGGGGDEDNVTAPGATTAATAATAASTRAASAPDESHNI